MNPLMADRPLHVRWLGRVRYQDALALQHGLHDSSADDHLLLLEHPHVYTLGVRADLGTRAASPADGRAPSWCAPTAAATSPTTGPGQLVGYPILHRAREAGRRHGRHGGLRRARSSSCVIDALGRPRPPRRRPPARATPACGSAPAADDPRKICAIGVRLSPRPDRCTGSPSTSTPTWRMFGHIVPCGIADKAVTSLRGRGHRRHDARGGRRRRRPGRRAVGCAAAHDRPTSCGATAPDDLSPFTRGRGPRRRPSATDAVGAGPSCRRAAPRCGCSAGWPRPASPRASTSAAASPSGCGPRSSIGRRGTSRIKRTMRDLDLVTVCEEAGCPNLSECWADGTATFMINGERCTRACGFCLVDTRQPAGRSTRRARAGGRGRRADGPRATPCSPTVARDDLRRRRGGRVRRDASRAIRAPHARRAGRGADLRLQGRRRRRSTSIFDARPDVLNHNIETVARLQRAVRPSAGYARSLAVLARAKAAGLTTKSGLIVGMGETDDEVVGRRSPTSRGVGVDIVTIGQYLRPTTHHLPVARWVDARRVRRAEARRRGHGHRPRRGRPARPARATTPARPRTPPTWRRSSPYPWAERQLAGRMTLCAATWPTHRDR